jgi:hypothetical protein
MMEHKDVNDTDLGASVPVPQPQPKQRPLQHGTVTECNHKLDLRRFPVHSNCDSCWVALLENNAQFLASVHTLLTEQGTQAVERVYGSKFVKYFSKYLRAKLLSMHEEQTAEPTGLSLEVKGMKEMY